MKTRHGTAGFTLLEVLVSLLLAGVLIGMLSRVMGQSLTNNNVLQASLENTTELTTFRRTLHRDIANMLVGTKLAITSEGLTMETSHNYLVSGPLPVTVSWTIKGATVVREERVDDMGYAQSIELLTLSGPSKVEFLDSRLKTWVNLSSWLLAPDRPMPLAMRMVLNVGGTEHEIVERIYDETVENKVS